jgi:hypothetical protein
MMAPTWLDKLIEPAVATGNAAAVAQAIAASPRLLAAIQRGLDDKAAPDVRGPSQAQRVAAAIREELAKEQ